MPDSSEPKARTTAADLRKEVLSAQERFNYFFLTLNGSAITFALVRTESQHPAIWMIPVAVAIACWGAGFYFGCEHLLLKIKIILGNLQYLTIKGGAKSNPAAKFETAETAMQQLRANAESDNERSRSYGRRQYGLFLIGAVFYIVAHVQRLFS